jgi:prepilin-type N-terminal cleavage/methylation domain-containing protein
MTERRDKGGFTLIELLVVVSIIALLLLLISPTVQLITEHRAKVACLRNLQSQHVAAIQYSNDFNGYLVAIHPTKTPTKTSYSDELIKYLEYNDSSYRCPSVVDLSYDLGSSNLKILNYGINHYGRADTKNGVSPYHKSMATPYIMIREIANTDVIYLADADYDQSPEDIGGVSRGTWDWPIRHSFQEDAWNRHMGRRDPVYARTSHYRNQYLDAFYANDPELKNFWGGYNAISLAGSGLWRRGYPATNRAWFIKKHQPQ